MGVSLGTVIHGTLRPQDLIPAFLAQLKKFDLAIADDIIAYHNYECSESFFATDTALFMLDALVTALNDCAGDDVYFGAHPGDGSDFGFWSVEE